MAAHPKPLLITVEEYCNLPEREDVVLELHWGRVVELSRPKTWHIDLQDRIADLLKARCGPNWRVRVEMSFRAVLQYDVRAVDVGVASKSRWDAARKGYLSGSPEIVIEILSPSNRRKEIADKMILFLSTGTRQFCAIDPNRQTVSVTGTDSKTLIYKMGDEVPFPLLGTSLKVSEIFSD